MGRKIKFGVNEYYHIYNRGNDKKIIFKDVFDYKRFVALLYLFNNEQPIKFREAFPLGLAWGELFKIKRGETLVDIGAYCLMSNHFHILVYEKQGGGLTKFMSKLSTAYSMYFNKKYKRTGGLFEGPFKAKHVNSDAYFNWLFFYIHLNPLKFIEPNWKEKRIVDVEKIRKYMDGYEYSSYYDYFLGDRTEGIILEKSSYPDHFSRLNDFKELLIEWEKAKLEKVENSPSLPRPGLGKREEENLVVRDTINI